MLAKRIPSILPPLILEEALETTKIHSIVLGGAAIIGKFVLRGFVRIGEVQTLRRASEPTRNKREYETRRHPSHAREFC
jgi:hypothetical protein